MRWVAARWWGDLQLLHGLVVLIEHGRKFGMWTKVISAPILILSLSAPGCSSEDQPQVMSVPSAVMVKGATVLEVIVGANLEGSRIPQVLAHEKVDYPWIAIQTGGVPLTPGETASLDLSVQTPEVVFRQNYRDTCNPASIEETTERCWFVETYHSGDVGLVGHVTLGWTGELFQAGFDVAWEGITDRFGEPQWHRHETSVHYAVAKQYVREVTP
jgi:hypothetical protein